MRDRATNGGMRRWFAAALAAAFCFAAASAFAEVRVERDLAYGPDPAQRFDAYIPDQPTGPVILMLHGGGWAFGDKARGEVAGAKMRDWTARGYVVVSANYRMLPAADPLVQAQDAARALAAAQGKAAGWGADADRFVLVGHSAGAHLVALLNAEPSLAAAQGARPWRGAVALDSAAMDVPALMGVRHFPLYDRAFGADPAYWRSQDLSHMEINALLGEPGAYTDAVSRWISSIL